MTAFTLNPTWAGILLLLLSHSLMAQLPIIKATSTSVNIKDGDLFRKGIWDLSPSIRPDRFYPIGPKRERKMTFYTDIDSISFQVKPGNTYDFIILLNGKDSCYTQICWPAPVKYTPSQDTIPFKLGADNRIHLTGHINNSEALDLLFDTGAYGVILSSSARNKVNLSFDGVYKALGYGGTYTDSTSSHNQLSIAGMKWDNVTVSYNERESSSGVIGFKVFENKIVEINYDQQFMVIHGTAFPVPSGYTQLDMQMRGRLPYIKVTLNDHITDWFCFDTGNAGCLSLDDEFSIQHDLYAALEKIGDGMAKGAGPNTIRNVLSLLPSLQIGEHTLTGIPTHLELPSRAENIPFSLIGNEVLKRFNTIIDYQNSYIYLQPNTLIKTAFRQSNPQTGISHLQVYTGTYELEDQSIVEISVENGQLTGRPKNGGKRVLRAIGQHRFFLKDEDLTFQFELDKAGQVNRLQLSQNGQQMSGRKVRP
ncbi:aspartyl protease family protein [Chitinophaga niabensis]|uniref:Aspartyl protease n=1 Tax=Chitinophaga niabensis TaxID=536979 RepID=A0A1N6D0N8_9BACT|nr:aspartyl protease family protein [Chitinophaga niabensis]SIN64289.1 Aspartyl protease [Chitinophaga niabensis]